MISFYATYGIFDRFFDQPWTGAAQTHEPGPSGLMDLGQYGSPLIWYGGLSISANIGHLTIIQFKNQFIPLVHVIWSGVNSHLYVIWPRSHQNSKKSCPKPIKKPILPHITAFSLNEGRYVERNFEKSDQWRVFLQEWIGNTNLLFIFRI